MALTFVSIKSLEYSSEGKRLDADISTAQRGTSIEIHGGKTKDRLTFLAVNMVPHPSFGGEVVTFTTVAAKREHLMRYSGWGHYVKKLAWSKRLPEGILIIL